MYNIAIGFVQFTGIVALLFLMWFFFELMLTMYEEVRERSARKTADILREENEKFLQQIEARRNHAPVDYPQGAGGRHDF